jgi:hypothetical protein
LHQVTGQRFRIISPVLHQAIRLKAFILRSSKIQILKIVKGLCNRAKHLSRRCVATNYTHGLNFDEIDCPIDDVLANFDEGPPTGFFVEDMEIGEILNRLLDEYRHKWFDRECT